jgi:hypothetical protein
MSASDLMGTDARVPIRQFCRSVSRLPRANESAIGALSPTYTMRPHIPLEPPTTRTAYLGVELVESGSIAETKSMFDLGYSEIAGCKVLGNKVSAGFEQDILSAFELALLCFFRQAFPICLIETNQIAGFR